MSQLEHNQKGFTILELLIATMVFSVIFLGVTTALIQMSKLYYKGVVTGRTQETARGTMDRIAQQLQFTGSLPTPPSSQNFNVTGYPAGQPATSLEFKAVCIGGSRYTYRLNAQVNDEVSSGGYDSSTSRLRHALWRDSFPPGTCPPADLSQAQPSADGEDMLSQHMRLTDFRATCDANNICTVAIGIIYGDNDLLEYDSAGMPVRCATIIGNQWCAASQFSTTVLKRVGE